MAVLAGCNPIWTNDCNITIMAGYIRVKICFGQAPMQTLEAVNRSERKNPWLDVNLTLTAIDSVTVKSILSKYTYPN